MAHARSAPTAAVWRTSMLGRRRPRQSQAFLCRLHLHLWQFTTTWTQLTVGPGPASFFTAYDAAAAPTGAMPCLDQGSFASRSSHRRLLLPRLGRPLSCFALLLHSQLTTSNTIRAAGLRCCGRAALGPLTVSGPLPATRARDIATYWPLSRQL